ncbi:hypothetical protein F4776DRAFT_650563 [Hypoxylon sp. NC0597]|nr:hypothetical protein F4776DRAFT_650563 [Hypoxylon sp. NC0597]
MSQKMNPYEADPTKIPATDRYADTPFYGRYKPHPDDFVPNPPPGPSTNDDVIRYWERVIVEKCTQANRMYEVDGWRDVFGLGSIIVMSSHLSVKPPEEDHALRDANDAAAIAVVRDCLRDIGVQVPTIYFQGKINERDVLIQSRLPGVILHVAWPYLTQAEKASFKEQGRQIVKKLDELLPPPTEGVAGPSYALPAANPVELDPADADHRILFGKRENVEGEEKLGFAHNDFQDSNIIVMDGKITGVIDWEMAGYFGLHRAGRIHKEVRCSNNYEKANLTEEQLADLNYWKDLYEGL